VSHAPGIPSDQLELVGFVDGDVVQAILDNWER
jgi:hypothetical protein